MDYYSKNELLNMAKTQLAIDLNCRSEDFNMKENTITFVRDNPGRRYYTEEPFSFYMASFGKGNVIAVEQGMQSEFISFFGDKNRKDLFEERYLMEINKKLQKYQLVLCLTTHGFLPDSEKTITFNKKPVKSRWFEDGEILELYTEKEWFPNALMYKSIPQRRDVLAIAAYNSVGEKIGLAGASADTEIMWQIGVDVKPEYQNQGIGKFLVTQLKNEIIRREAVPFYSTSTGNLISRNLAIQCGFFPAWVEISSVEKRCIY